jgi:hypothetical protein
MSDATTAEHPAAFDLEAWHAGEDRPAVAAHVAACARCRGLVAELDAARAVFRASADPAGFARRVRRGAEERAWAARRTWWAAFGGAAVAAAAIALVALLPGAAGPAGPSSDAAAAPGGDPFRAAPPGLRAKADAPGLAVVVLRDGAQARHAGGATLRAGDRLRVELTVPQPAVLSVGLLADDGAWLPLADARRFSAGVHYLEPAVALDGDGTAGRFVAGPPDAVAAYVRGEEGRVSVLPLQSAP